MIVFKNNTDTRFKAVYTTAFDPSVNTDDVIVVLQKFNAEDIEYTVEAEIISYDCYNRIIEVEANVGDLETGEYKMYLSTIGAYSLDYSDEYSRIDEELYAIYYDNANIKRETDFTEKSTGVAYIE